MLISNQPGTTSLLAPLAEAVSKSSEIVIATAYVGPGACELLHLIDRCRIVPVRLVIGRALQDGLPLVTKNYLSVLDREARPKKGGVRISHDGFHSKIYATDTVNILGSSNLTENGLGNWIESNFLLEHKHAGVVHAEADRLWNASVDLGSVLDDIEVIQRNSRKKARSKDNIVSILSEPSAETMGISISLLDNKGEVSEKAGLNWGLAGGRVRDRFEAYIRFPNVVHEEAAHVFGSTSKGTILTAHTHDGTSFKLRLEGNSRKGEVTAKQISTLHDKSKLGKWMIEKCLGIKDGRRITLRDLQHYGRTTVDFYRSGIDDDGNAIVFIDFSPK